MNLDVLPPDLRKRFLEAEAAAKHVRYLSAAERADAFAKTNQLRAEVQALADSANVTDVIKALHRSPTNTREAIAKRLGFAT